VDRKRNIREINDLSICGGQAVLVVNAFRPVVSLRLFAKENPVPEWGHCLLPLLLIVAGMDSMILGRDVVCTCLLQCSMQPHIESTETLLALHYWMRETRTISSCFI
jgi:hypothetical protein